MEAGGNIIHPIVVTRPTEIAEPRTDLVKRIADRVIEHRNCLPVGIDPGRGREIDRVPALARGIVHRRGHPVEIVPVEVLPQTGLQLDLRELAERTALVIARHREPITETAAADTVAAAAEIMRGLVPREAVAAWAAEDSAAAGEDAVDSAAAVAEAEDVAVAVAEAEDAEAEDVGVRNSMRRKQ